MREYKLLNILIKRYSIEFMEIVSFDRKFDSLAYLVSDKLKKKMDEKFRNFNFTVDLSKYPKYNIGEKCGEDIYIKPKMKTIKDFLNDD